MTATTLLMRQAHPKFMAGQIITSQVFMPFPKDEGLLSAYDGDQITASDSYAHYTQILRHESHSVWAVTKAEADQEGCPGSPDPKPDSPSHAKIDFTEKSDSTCRKVAKRLKAMAIARGCQYSSS